MDKKEALKDRKSFLVLILLCVVLFMPFFIQPSLLSSKDNDLGRTYIPTVTFMKNTFWHNFSLPLWRSEQLFGEPFFANPVFTLIYPGNILFLILPAAIASVMYYFLHLILAGVSVFYLARSFSISRHSSIASSVFYVFSTKMFLHISAGHITMVAAFCFLPLVFLASRKILHENKYIWILWFAVSLSLMLSLYATIFYYTILFIATYITYFLIVNNKLTLKFKVIRVPILFLFGFLLCICFSAIFLLPQIEFAPLSSRVQLTIGDVAIPTWNIKLFTSSLFFPYPFFKDLDHEAFLYIGLVPTILSVAGFFYLSNIKKIMLASFTVFALLFAAGLSTPLFRIAYTYLPLLHYSRATTRFWFIVTLITALLCGYALDRIKKKALAKILIGVFVVEAFTIGLVKIYSIPNLSFNNLTLYEKISADKSLFRVYCTTYCFNPQLTSLYSIQTLNGESPIQDRNFLALLQSAGAYSYNNFAVIFPPYQVWKLDKPPQPNSALLGLANVKYVASTYELTNDNFILDNKYENIYLYQNSKFRSRVYFEDTQEEATVTSIEANKITISYPKSNTPKTLVFSELYYPGWNAYSNGEKIVVEKLDTASRKVTIPSDSNKTELKFEPKSFVIGKSITFSTILFLAITFWFNKSKHQYG